MVEHEELLRLRQEVKRLWMERAILKKPVGFFGLLAPIYEWFTEGFDTADLQDAKALLEEVGL